MPAKKNIMPTTITKLEAAQEALDAAQAAADRARAAAEAAQAAADARRARALAAYDQQLLDDHDDDAVQAEVEAARERLFAAVEADPVYAAMADLAAVITSAYLRSVDAARAAQQLGRDDVQVQQRSPADDMSVDTLLAHMARLGAARAAQAAADADARRTAAGDAAAEGGTSTPCNTVEEADPMRCSARRRDGSQCRASAVTGATVCRMHGGSAG